MLSFQPFDMKTTDFGDDNDDVIAVDDVSDNDADDDVDHDDASLGDIVLFENHNEVCFA